MQLQLHLQVQLQLQLQLRLQLHLHPKPARLTLARTLALTGGQWADDRCDYGSAPSNFEEPRPLHRSTVEKRPDQ